MPRRFHILSVAVFSLAFLVPAVFAQQAQDPSNSAQKSGKTSKKNQRQAWKELGKEYRNWLEEDVPYIISPEERSAFLQLSTNEEREQFIEQFWLRRNENPDLPDNAFKEEHYRRIAYANEHFASGMPGWRTDRGRIYITWGPPDEREEHTAGEQYDRPTQEGGGSTTTYAWESWRYRHLDDPALGENTIFEFVDPTGSGEFRFTTDPSEKDALTHVPGAGLSMMEQMGLASKADRWTNADGTLTPRSITGASTGTMDEFNRLQLAAAAFKGPSVKFKDLEALVTHRIVRDELHFDWRTDFMMVTSDTVLVPITIQIPNKQLQFQSKDGVHSAKINIFGRVSSLTGRVVQTFEDTVSRDFPESLFQQSLSLFSIYQKAVPLRPGLYRLDLVIKDEQSGNVGVENTRLAVPRYEDDRLAASSMILADQIEHVSAKQIGTGQFVIGSTKVRPRLAADFASDDKLGIYLQIYNLKVDDKAHKPNATMQYVIKKGDEEVFNFKETSEQLKQNGEQMTIERLLPLSTLTPGKYSLQVSATDLLTNQTVSRTADFTVKAPKGIKAAANSAPGR